MTPFIVDAGIVFAIAVLAVVVGSIIAGVWQRGL
jgi:hypothetical protein